VESPERPVRPLDRGDVTAVALSVLYGAAFSVLSLLRHVSFNTHTFDLGLHHQATWNTLHGRFFQYTLFANDVHDLQNLLGDHVNLVLLLAVPFYRLWDGAGTLLVLQAVVVGSAAFPLYRVAREVTGGAAAALLLVVAYLLNPALHAANLFDFHAIVVAAAFLIWAFWRARAGGTWSLGIAVGLALLCQENVALAVVCLGASIGFLGRRRAGLAVAVAGAAWFAVCFYLILPHFNPGIGSNAFSRYRDFGDAPAAIVLGLLRDPSRLGGRLLEPATRDWLFSLFAPFGFIPLLAPHVLVVGASELFLNLISSFPLQRTIDFQYAAIPVAAAALASPWGTRTVARRLGPHFGLETRTAAAVAAGLVVASTLGFQAVRWRNLRFLANPYRASYRATEHSRMARRFLDAIPPGATVSAQDAIAPHLNRAVVWCFPQVRNADAVLLDLSGSTIPVSSFPLRGQAPEASFYEYVQRLLAGGAYRVENAADGWLLLSRARGLEPADAVRPGADGGPPPVLFRAALRIVDAPAVAPAGSAVSLAVEIENASDAVFFPRTEAPTGFATGVAAYWIDPATGSGVDAGDRLWLAARLEPGGRATLRGTVTAPAEPGRWLLVLDPVTDRVARFSAYASPTVSAPIAVTPAP
jgi:uncharacterized membrane protein